ncbi:MAG: hypothetical protein JO303_08955 [Caulobacteraceae bacterium]|nr:hypothetical protein [Caulobacteraceae bacterium]
MTVRIADGIIFLEGACAAEDAELLVAAFEAADGGPVVDLSECRHLHCALVQTLLHFGANVRGRSNNPFIRDFVAPALQLSAPGRVNLQPAFNGSIKMDQVSRKA